VTVVTVGCTLVHISARHPVACVTGLACTRKAAGRVRARRLSVTVVAAARCALVHVSARGAGARVT
jgi:predicted ArsR family transcriptional regulator